ncbi:unnamed protein product [Staurois parvus]|uniref:Uncharacterized protein n=1 Tax=Staurois parvus TaxID=386267 RepID=A0ABN9DE13_9NEOB|nr:unnamed protein product [Staurois parvus]
MQTASTNICKRLGRSQELCECKRGTVKGCPLCNKSICEISWLLNIPQSNVSGIITKLKQLGNNNNIAGHTGLWSSGDVFSGVTNHTSLSGNPMDVSGFHGCQEKSPCLTALCQV